MIAEITEKLCYDSILVNWERSKKDFMLWIEHVCGYNRESDVHNKLTEAISGNDDILLWIEEFSGSFDDIVEATMRFLDKKNYWIEGR